MYSRNCYQHNTTSSDIVQSLRLA